MYTLLDDRATARDLLFGATPGVSAQALAESLHENGIVAARLRGLPGVADVERAVADSADGLLALNLVDLLTVGWKKFGALRQAAERTRVAPHTEERVVLVTHSIDSSHKPSVELYANGTSLGTVDMTLSITFTVKGARALVQRARLMAITSGTCVVAGSLTIAGKQAAKKQREWDLPGAVRLHHGIALLGTSSNTAQFDTARAHGAGSMPTSRV